MNFKNAATAKTYLYINIYAQFSIMISLNKSS